MTTSYRYYLLAPLPVGEAAVPRAKINRKSLKKIDKDNVLRMYLSFRTAEAQSFFKESKHLWIHERPIRLARKLMWRYNYGSTRKLTGFSVCSHPISVADGMFHETRLDHILSPVERALLGILHDCPEDYLKKFKEASAEGVIDQVWPGKNPKRYWPKQFDPNRREILIHYLSLITDPPELRGRPLIERLQNQFDLVMADKTGVLAALRFHDKRTTLLADHMFLKRKPDAHLFQTREKYQKYMDEYAMRYTFLMRMPLPESDKRDYTELWNRHLKLVRQKMESLPLDQNVKAPARSNMYQAKFRWRGVARATLGHGYRYFCKPPAPLPLQSATMN